jgi:hypothetical protein
MTTYKIEIREELSRVIDIDAENLHDALDKAREMYKNEEIVLDVSDYLGVDISQYE